MMQINRALVLFTGKIDIASLCDENKQILECISKRNRFELYSAFSTLGSWCAFYQVLSKNSQNQNCRFL